MSIDAEFGTFQGKKVTVMGDDVWVALARLSIGDEILDEVLCLLKGIQPGERVPWLEQTFGELDFFDDGF